ncbi:hypothetical protein CONLIGDRAFT_643012 [Coniochaeta ligniaria NRRL 30616]|uniref:Uncharacterized protein n=1 Tax=Coniochaeta ligniaria NRRL 30616 TaxID=1408157 RepID=A0A1J7JM76_9PEZI|nr:hypothetical protein CONLIGDRAFT_643012 [Coniochaeta ligniaria NRRL 30616]
MIIPRCETFTCGSHHSIGAKRGGYFGAAIDAYSRGLTVIPTLSLVLIHPRNTPLATSTMIESARQRPKKWPMQMKKHIHFVNLTEARKQGCPADGQANLPNKCPVCIEKKSTVGRQSPTCSETPAAEPLGLSQLGDAIRTPSAARSGTVNSWLATFLSKGERTSKVTLQLAVDTLHIMLQSEHNYRQRIHIQNTATVSRYTDMAMNHRDDVTCLSSRYLTQSSICFCRGSSKPSLPSTYSHR